MNRGNRTGICSPENYIVRTDDTASEIGDTDASDQGYDFTIDPGEYRIVSGWEKVALEIRSSSGKDETVKFDEADHEEKIELHAGDEVSVVFWMVKIIILPCIKFSNMTNNFCPFLLSETVLYLLNVPHIE